MNILSGMTGAARPQFLMAMAMATTLMMSAAVGAPAASADILDLSTPGVYVQEIDNFGAEINPAPALQVIVGQAVIPSGTSISVTSTAEFAALTSSASAAVTQAVEDYFTNGGVALTVVGAESAQAPDLITAIESIAVAGSLDLAVPELRGLGDGDWQEVATELIATAVTLDAIAWLDPPADVVGHEVSSTFSDPGGVAALAAQLRSTAGEGAAQAVLLNGGVVDAEGQARAATPGVLGMRSSTDSNEGQWANMDPYPGLVGVTPEDPLPLAGLGVLTAAGVTSIFRLDDQYTTPDIAVTLETADDVHYASTRRMLLWLQQSVRAGMANYVFSPNDMSTWVSMTSMISSFLTGIWQEGGLEGNAADESFTVNCSATPDMILNGYLQCAVRVDLITSNLQEFNLMQDQSV